MGRLKLGIALPLSELTIRATEAARAVEERGFESMWAGEHSHLPVDSVHRYTKGRYAGSTSRGGRVPEMYQRFLDPFVVLAERGRRHQHHQGRDCRVHRERTQCPAPRQRSGDLGSPVRWTPRARDGFWLERSRGFEPRNRSAQTARDTRRESRSIEGPVDERYDRICRGVRQLCGIVGLAETSADAASPDPSRGGPVSSDVPTRRGVGRRLDAGKGNGPWRPGRMGDEVETNRRAPRT